MSIYFLTKNPVESWGKVQEPLKGLAPLTTEYQCFEAHALFCMKTRSKVFGCVFLDISQRRI